MSQHVYTRLDDEIRAGVARVMDVLLPGTETLPSASSVSAHGELLDRVLITDPLLEPLVRRAGELAKEREFNFEDLRTWMGDDLERLIFALHAAYYMSSTVRESLRYPGQIRLPVSLATPDQVGTDELLEPVKSRGQIFVPTPER